MKIEMQSEISALFATIRNYTDETQQFLITLSEQWSNRKKGEYLFSNLILKNKINSNKKDLFTVIKPIKWEIKDNEIWLFPNDEKFNIAITGFNIFNDLVYDKSNNMIYFSNTGLWNIEFFDLSISTGTKKSGIILSWLKNPTWLTLSSDKLYFSESSNHAIKSIDKNKLNVSDIANGLNWSIELVTWTESKPWFGWNQLNYPNWLSFWNWHIYIIDSWNNAIKVLNINTNKLTILAAKKLWNDNFYNLFLDNPTDIEYVTDLNSIIFTDTNNNRILLCELETAIKIKASGCMALAWAWNWTWEYAWKAWFSWDFTLWEYSQLNRPTWLSIDTKRTMYFSDSWNNLIRKIFVPFPHLNLKTGQSIIETVIWNSGIKTTNIWWDWIYDTIDDKKESTKAPRWWYSDINVFFIWDWTTDTIKELQKNTEALLNIPTWIALVDHAPIFIDSFNGSLRAWILWHTHPSSLLLYQTAIIDEDPWTIPPWDVWTWQIITLIRKSIKSINIDNIWVSRMDDYISTQAIYRMFFDVKTLINPLIKLSLSVVNYSRPENPIYTDLETSFTLRDN